MGTGSASARPERFRRRLASLVARTRWAGLGRTDELARKHGEKLWLHPEALKAAYAIVAEERKRQGLKAVLSRRTKENASGLPQIAVQMPAPIGEEFQDWCDSHAMKPSVVIRALVQQYLCSTWEPAYRGQDWFFKGRMYPRGGHLERSLITQGAVLALCRRAKRVNVEPRALVRSLILELLEGRIRSLKPIDARSMWDDPDRYPYPS